MNVRNIISFAILTSLLAITQTQCMMHLVNKTIEKVSTVVGLSLAAGPLVKDGFRSAYIRHTSPESLCANQEIMSTKDQEFYRSLFKDTKIQLRTTNQPDNAFTVGNIIILPKTINTDDGLFSLDDARTQNNENALSVFRGIAEHEYQHYLNGDDYITQYVKTIVPATTTIVAGIILKKGFPLPFSSSFAENIERAAIKIGACNMAFKANKEITDLSVAYLRRRQEHAADSGISNKNRRAFAQYLRTLYENDIKYEVNYEKKLANIMRREPDIAKVEIEARAKQESEYTSLYSQYPSPLQRAAALYTAKKS